MPGDPKECRQHTLNCVHLAKGALKLFSEAPRPRELWRNDLSALVGKFPTSGFENFDWARMVKSTLSDVGQRRVKG